MERIFRDAKTLLETRPIFHQKTENIRGHVFCSFLALVLRKELESAKSHTNKTIRDAEVVSVEYVIKHLADMFHSTDPYRNNFDEVSFMRDCGLSV